MCRKRKWFRELVDNEVKFILMLVAHIVTSILLSAYFTFGHPKSDSVPQSRCETQCKMRMQ